MRRVSLLLAVIITACSAPAAGEPARTTDPAPTTTTTFLVPTTTVATTTTTVPATTTTNPFARPDWLGTRPLPLRPDGHGEVLPTPEELQDRRLETIDLLEPPNTRTYQSSIEEIPPDVLARSSWTEECPVTLDELRYLTVSHFGFDGETHTGEIIVNTSEAEGTGVLEELVQGWRARFPSVPVDLQVSHGRAAAVLEKASEDADLLILARRQHPAPPYGRLGGTAHALLWTSRCPVEVVPAAVFVNAPTMPSRGSRTI